VACRIRAGYSLVELLVVAALVAALAAVGLPVLVQAADAADAVAAARHVAALVARARFEAARRNRVVAVRFDAAAGDETRFSLVVDGDGDGVGAEDVAAGIDPVIRGPDRLSAHFGAVRFGLAAGVAGIDGGAALAAGDDPIRLGAARQVSLSPIGTASSGTLYIVSGRGVHYAVRIAGVTGRVRVLRYLPAAARWVPV
jgi:prepilin-type N-terminal cleavage/methylation domain-containing protein